MPIIKGMEWTFDTVASSYEKFRPGYVPELYRVLFDYIRRNMPDYELDFIRIWNLQSVYPELANQIRRLCTEVYEFITRDDRKTENVTQWCKQT